MGPLKEYFEVLACVARADGVVQTEEVDAWRQALAAVGVGDEESDRLGHLMDMKEPLDTAQILQSAAQKISPLVLAEVLRDSYIMASADGHVAPAEVAVIEQLLVRTGLTENQRAMLHTWAQTAATHHMDGLHLITEFMPRAT